MYVRLNEDQLREDTLSAMQEGLLEGLLLAVCHDERVLVTERAGLGIWEAYQFAPFYDMGYMHVESDLLDMGDVLLELGFELIYVDCPHDLHDLLYNFEKFTAEILSEGEYLKRMLKQF